MDMFFHGSSLDDADELSPPRKRLKISSLLNSPVDSEPKERDRQLVHIDLGDSHGSSQSGIGIHETNNFDSNDFASYDFANYDFESNDFESQDFPESRASPSRLREDGPDGICYGMVRLTWTEPLWIIGLL